VSPPTPSGNKYFLLLVDDMSRYMWLHLLSSKNQAAVAIKNFQATVEVESGRKLKVLRTDRGGEFTSVEFGEHCARCGVQRQLTAPYTPQQNGVVERCNQTVVDMAHSILKAKALSSFFWGEAVHTAVHLLNQAPTRALDGKTPFEAWYGEHTAVHYLRTFGCVAHVKTTKSGLQKLDDRSTPTIFVGYESGSKAYKCYDPSTKRVVISRDVVFDEAARWDWSSSLDVHPGDDEPFTIEFITEAVQVPGTMPSASPPPAQSPLPGPAAATTPQGSPGGASSPYFATPPVDVDHDALDADHDDDARCGSAPSTPSSSQHLHLASWLEY
jgi:hypothetical protein